LIQIKTALKLYKGSHFHFQTADLLFFLTIGVKYLETLGFMLKVGTCHYTEEFFPRKNKGFENGLFSPFLAIFCLHNAKSPCIFLPLATVLASVIRDFEILNKCTFWKDKHYF
jgi:hypothetical protein